MTAPNGLGIRRVEAIHYYVRDLERSRRFYCQSLDFAEVGESGSELVEGGHQRALVFEAGQCRVVCSTPVGAGGRAHRFLQKHPDGVGSIVFEVADIEHTFRLLEARGGTPVCDIQESISDNGRYRSFVLASAFGDTTFRFVERRGDYRLYPGFQRYEAPHGGSNRFGFLEFDHITSNFETMSPALLWMEHVLGFQRFWQVEFHTDEVGQQQAATARGPSTRAEHHGSGLRSVVMWDPESGAKFANNEPYRPNFKASQVNVFHEEHRGDGVQHVALATRDILTAVRGLRERGVQFMPTPHAYYEALSARMQALGIQSVGAELAELEQQQILVDGDGDGRYLLQIFLVDSAGLYQSAEAGPFFYEIIQRAGDSGFGAGNFRALFESIEREQLRQGVA